jgi:hypothetical protein
VVDNLQRSWNENIASIRNAVDDRKAEYDVKAAQRKADRADDDAAFAIDYAYAAIEEAEYAVAIGAVRLARSGRRVVPENFGMTPSSLLSVCWLWLL